MVGVRVLVVEGGIDRCRMLRHDAGLAAPVIMLSAKGDLAEKLAAFDSGADDYLVKSVALPALEAHVHPLVRRTRNLQRA